MVPPPAMKAPRMLPLDRPAQEVKAAKLALSIRTTWVSYELSPRLTSMSMVFSGRSCER